MIDEGVTQYHEKTFNQWRIPHIMLSIGVINTVTNTIKEVSKVILSIIPKIEEKRIPIRCYRRNPEYCCANKECCQKYCQ